MCELKFAGANWLLLQNPPTNKCTCDSETCTLQNEFSLGSAATQTIVFFFLQQMWTGFSCSVFSSVNYQSSWWWLFSVWSCCDPSTLAKLEFTESSSPRATTSPWGFLLVRPRSLKAFSLLVFFFVCLPFFFLCCWNDFWANKDAKMAGAVLLWWETLHFLPRTTRKFCSNIWDSFVWNKIHEAALFSIFIFSSSVVREDSSRIRELPVLDRTNIRSLPESNWLSLDGLLQMEKIPF